MKIPAEIAILLDQVLHHLERKSTALRARLRPLEAKSQPLPHDLPSPEEEVATFGPLHGPDMCPSCRGQIVLRSDDGIYHCVGFPDEESARAALEPVLRRYARSDEVKELTKLSACGWSRPASERGITWS